MPLLLKRTRLIFISVNLEIIRPQSDSSRRLCVFYVLKPRVITVDKNPAYPIAISGLKKEKKMPLGIQIRQIKYLNNIVEQDHRFMKRRIHFMLGLNSFRTATCILAGVEAMHMRKKEQIDLRD